MDEKSQAVYKYHTEHVEHPIDSKGSSAVQGAMVTKPARELTPEEEARLYRKLDIHLLPMLGVLYLLSFMDRGNIGNARLAGLETDLGMAGYDYAIALTAFFASYCLFEVPANLMLKKLRPSLWLASITVVWGTVMTLMGVAQSFGGLVAARVALGIAEAGLFPGVVFYLTTWYPRHRCQLRIALFFGAATIAGAFSGLLAYGIGFMGGVGGYSGWRWIFILEGLMTVIAGVVAFWALTDYPATASWLSEDEKAWIIWRKAADGSSVGEAEHITWPYIKQALTSWQVWLSTAYYMSVVAPLYAVALFSPTLINAFGKYTRPQVQLLTIPYYVFACIYVVVTAYYSDKLQKRFPFVFLCQILCLIGFIINISPAPSGAKYFGIFLTAAGAYGGLPAVVTWLSNNLAGQTKRGVGSAFQIGIGNLAGIASSNVYRSVDSPRYLVGHGVQIGFVVLGLITAPLYHFLLKRANAAKERELAFQASLPDHEKRVYTVQELRDLGDEAPEFVYTL
ncbi:MFS general substrate transporter [Leucosporidium creatinivorum]|uniref:MFS general substrate transporter n=1 Tax=Leucosporidium creatinivorum TaxID=106004 RepID=A0A1Y2D792_9BASI|nr:MFS general substrate transporter [Leucosporidium creatinivorum]